LKIQALALFGKHRADAFKDIIGPGVPVVIGIEVKNALASASGRFLSCRTAGNGERQQAHGDTIYVVFKQKPKNFRPYCTRKNLLFAVERYVTSVHKAAIPV
jgi:hypothetical protein